MRAIRNTKIIAVNHRYDNIKSCMGLQVYGSTFLLQNLVHLEYPYGLSEKVKPVVPNNSLQYKKAEQARLVCTCSALFIICKSIPIQR